MRKSLKIILIAILVVIVTASIISYRYFGVQQNKMLRTQKPPKDGGDQQVSISQEKSKPRRKIPTFAHYVDPKSFKDDPAIFLQNDVLDKCLGIDSYKGKDFFTTMVEALELREGNGINYLLPRDHPFSAPDSKHIFTAGSITDACYSKILDRVILLSYSGDMKSLIAVIEYDVKKRKAIQVFSREQTFMPPEQFGIRKGSVIEMTRDDCFWAFWSIPKDMNGEYEIDNLTDEQLKGAQCQKSLFTYDLVKKEIKSVYEKNYIPTRERLKHGR